ncbi:MAG: FliM/FliN family flagellar motor switch protein [Roseiarcus sp.]
MALEERDSAATSSWLHMQQPEHHGLSIEKSPGLGFALEQFALNAPEAVSPLFKAHSSGTIDEMRPTRLFEFIGGCEGLTAAVLHSEQLDARLLLIFDRRIVDTVVTAVFGGDATPEGAPAAPSRPNRSLTSIESRLVAELARRLGKALDKGFAQVASLGLAFERLETLVDVYALGRRDMPAVAGRLTVETSGGPIVLTILMPQTLLAPIRKNLSFDPESETPASDPRWTRQMENGVTKTRIAVTAVLDELEMTLGDIADLAVGQVLSLHGAGMGRVRLECGGREMFWCTLGQGEGRYSLEIEEPIELDRDPLEGAFVH